LNLETIEDNKMKTIKLIFSINRETFFIEICNMQVVYKDRKISQSMMLVPKDPDSKKRVIMSRNRIPAYIIDFIEQANSGKNLDEYQAAKTNEDLVKIVMWDGKSREAKFEKREDNE